MKKLSFKNSFILLTTAVLLVSGFFVVNNVFAVAGEGTATINDGANVTVTKSTSNVFTIVLTVGASGITVDAANPTFTIPTGFTAPKATPVATPGDVLADGDWSAVGGATCPITMGSSSAAGQVMTVDVTTVCTVEPTEGKITLTYKGTSNTAMGATALAIKTADDIGNSPVVPISAPPTITVTEPAVPCTGTVGPSVFVSSTSGSDSNNDGSEFCPFATIQAAINDVNTESGDTIIVGAGTYHEQVIIDKAVSVLGAGAAITFIDGTGLAADPLVNITTATGNVIFDGFTVQNGGILGGRHFQMSLGNGNPGDVVTISNNIIICSGDDTVEDYGLYGHNGLSNLVFSGNDVSNCTYTGIFFERYKGATDIFSNTFTGLPDSASAIGFMTYENPGDPAGSQDVTTKQWVHDNDIDANGSSGILFMAPFGRSYNQYNGGSYTNVVISGNEITNVGDNSKGIQLEVDGDNGGFVNPLITGNTISAQNPGSGTSRGIRIMGVVTDAQITDNETTGLYRGIYQSDSFSHLVYPAGTLISGNAITGGTYGIDIAGGTATIHLNSIVGNTLFGVNNQTVATIDATNNWWGAASGPLDDKDLTESGIPNYSNPLGTGDPVTSYVDYKPWCTDLGCTTFSSAKEILTFSFPEGAGVITGTNIAVDVPFGTSVTALVPTITLSTGATVSPLSGVAQNFTSPVTYTVTGADTTSTQAYIVTVTVAVPVTLSSIAVTTPATKLSYTVGDTLDLTGLGVTGTYSDASTQVETITPADVTGFDSTAPVVGQVLTITFNGKTTTYTVDVVAVPVNNGGGGGVAYYSVSASAGANGSISPSGLTSVASGNSQTYTITPATGYQIADVLVDGTSVGTITTYTFSNVTSTHTISAIFSIIPAVAGAETTAGDANGDGNIDELDFSLLMSQWGQTGSGLSADLNKDGTVDELDFSILMANWGL